MDVLENLEKPHHPELYARGSYSLLDASPSQLANNANTFILQVCTCSPLMTRQQSSHHQIQESAGAMREERDKILLSLVNFY